MTTNRCKTWSFRVEQLFASIDHAYFLGTRNVNTRSVLLSREPELKVISHTVWKEKHQLKMMHMVVEGVSFTKPLKLR